MKSFFNTILIVMMGLLAMNFNCFAQTDLSNATIVQTSAAGDNLKDVGNVALSKKAASGIPLININPEQKFQKIAGFGGAFTGSSAYLINKLNKIKREQIIKAYFSPNGADYSLMRTQIGGSDFSVTSYSYDDTPGDTNLVDFSIKKDLEYLIPLIKEAQKASKNDIKILASPWTAPKWMKDNDAWYGGSLKPEYYQTWALYLSKYIKAYQKEGINIWALTPENEPLGNDSHWDSMIFTPEQMRDLIKNNIGPQFAKDKIDSRIFIYDQNCDAAEQWANIILSDPGAAKYVYGTAIHWYSSTISWFPDVLEEIHNKFPGKQILHTEGCIDSQVPVWNNDAWYWEKTGKDWGYKFASEKEKPLHPIYRPVYRYIRDIIGNLNNWVTGWIDWNIVLDDKGGPNHANNWAIAPVLVKPDKNEIYYTPLYYVMCHFSKYIRPDAYRIGAKTDIKNLMLTACLNPDGKIAVEIFNPTKTSIKYQIKLENKFMQFNIPAEALQTVIIR